jgi:ABC-type bacteriocin/lantibiotic exporter with double-glycine peptidase domain
VTLSNNPKLASRIHYVKQRGEDDCGLACIAMFIDKPYTHVRSKLEGQFKNSRKYETKYPKLLKCARTLGLRLKNPRKANRWRDIPPYSIVSTDYRGKRKYWHWVVFLTDKNGWFVFDPWMGRKKLRSMKGRQPGRYLKVARVNKQVVV